MLRPLTRSILAACAFAAALSAQGGVGNFPGSVPGIPPAPVVPLQPTPAPAQQQPRTQPTNPLVAKPGDKTGTQTQPQSNAADSAPSALKLDSNIPFMMDNVPLTEMIEALAKQLKMKYLLDPRVKGSVTIHTYGEVKPVELMPLFQTLLRVNGMAMVQVGDLWRILPANAVSNLPMEPMQITDGRTLPDDERMILNLVFLKYTTAKEMDALLGPFMGEHATHTAYDPANLLFIEDNARSMKRTMELVAMFDSDTFADKRVRSFEMVNSRPSDMAKELEQVMKAYSVTEKSGVRFIPIDHINTLLAVAPNPGVFEQVKKWIEKLDVKPKVTNGTSNLWVYQLKYQRAEIVALAVQALYTGNTAALIQMSQMLNASTYAAGIGNNGTGGLATGGYGTGGGGGYGNSGYGNSGYGNSGYGNSGYGNSGYGMSGYGNAYGNGYAGSSFAPTNLTMQGSVPGASQQTQPSANANDGTGTYLGAQGAAGANAQRMPHVVPNPFNNTLLIQGSEQEYEQIANMLRQLDVAPRQVLLDIKIYEVDLSDAFSAGVSSYLQDKGTTNATGSSSSSSSSSGLSPQQGLNAVAGSGGLQLTAGALVLGSKQLLGMLSASESKGKTRVISSPSIIATDGMAATMNVGDQVPVLTSTSSTSVTSGGSSVFANTVSYQSTGVTVSITPHISSSGVVTMAVTQQVSAPVGTDSGTGSSSIGSDSFSNRSMSTQLTIMDGDTVAIGGAISETHKESSSGVPFLHRLPGVGALFGSKSISTSRSELIIFITPRVIYDSTQLLDATEELKANLKRVGKLMKDDQ